MAKNISTHRILKDIFEKGKAISGNLFKVVYKKTGEHKDKTIFLFKKAIGTAVKRNRIKRIIREKRRNLKDKLKGLSLVFVPTGKLKEADENEIKKEIDSIFEGRKFLA